MSTSKETASTSPQNSPHNRNTMLCALNNLPLNVAKIAFIKVFSPRISNGSSRFIITAIIFFIFVTTIN